MLKFSVITMILGDRCMVSAQTYMYYFQKLTHIPKEIPGNAKKIYLNNNWITDIESGAFAHNLLCVKLRLDWNRLMEIRNDMWSGLVALEYLSLEHNAIEYIHPSAFADLQNLTGLYLHDNKLTTFHESIFPPKQMLQIEIITLHENNLHHKEVDWLHKLCDNGQIEEYTIPGDDISCISRSNNNDAHVTTAQSDNNTQGKSHALVFVP